MRGYEEEQYQPIGSARGGRNLPSTASQGVEVQNIVGSFDTTDAQGTNDLLQHLRVMISKKPQTASELVRSGTAEKLVSDLARKLRK